MAGKVASPTRSADEGLELPAATPAFSHWSATQWTVLKSGDAALAAIGVAVTRRTAARVAVAQRAILLMFAFTLCLPPVCDPIGTGRPLDPGENKSHAEPGAWAGGGCGVVAAPRRWHRYLGQVPAVSSAGRQRVRQALAGSPRTTHVTPYRRRA